MSRIELMHKLSRDTSASEPQPQPMFVLDFMSQLRTALTLHAKQVEAQHPYCYQQVHVRSLFWLLLTTSS